MYQEKRKYSVLVVSSAQSFSASVSRILSEGPYESPVCVISAAAARRECRSSSFDMIIVNSPLADEFGTELITDIAGNRSIGLLLVKSEQYEDTRTKLSASGIYTLEKPTSAQLLRQSLAWMNAMRERIRKTEKKAVTLESRMEEIRTVNRAKWLLIEKLKMSEEDAHRYIEKQAMNHCASKLKIAEHIIESYS